MNKLLETLDPELLAPVEVDPRYQNSPFANLSKLHAKQRGSRYEKIVIALMTKLQHSYKKRTNSDHDAIFDEIRYEIKGSMLNANTQHFSFMQIRPNQNYDEVMFAMFYPHRIVLMTMDKPCVFENIASKKFKPQHGGELGDSKTYLYYGEKHSLAALGARLLYEIE